MKVLYLIWGFIRGKVRWLYKSVLTRSSLARKLLRAPNTAGSSSLYCYELWMQHLKNWSRVHKTVPEIIVEIGPGDSLGVGLAALLSGSKTYYALEKTQFWNIETNLKVFDELVEFFKERKQTQSIDKSKISKDNKVHLEFPSDILTPSHLSHCLAKERLDAIRQELLTPEAITNQYIHSIIPWNSAQVIKANSVDYIFSHTVLQHLDDLSFAYSTMNLWLKDKGCLSHSLDLTCMNRTKLWNAHWTFSKLEWKIITGGISLINREPLSTHLRLLELNKFKVIYENAVLSHNTLTAKDLSKDFKHLNQSDLTTSGFYYFAQIHKEIPN